MKRLYAAYNIFEKFVIGLIMLLLIAATSLFSTDDKDHSNEGGGLW